jgi:hypothetical protein
MILSLRKEREWAFLASPFFNIWIPFWMNADISVHLLMSEEKVFISPF